MPENTNERIEHGVRTGDTEAENRAKRTRASRDFATLITEHENPDENSNDIFKDKVVDVLELLDSKEDNENIKKLNRLREYGVTDDMIISIYKDFAGGVTNKEAALEVLGMVFRNLAAYISDLPNAIVINPETGYIDEKASIAQGYARGIYSDSREFFYLDKDGETLAQRISRELKSEIEPAMTYERYMAWDLKCLKDALNNQEIIEAFEKNVDKSFEKSAEEMDVSFDLTRYLVENREAIERHKFETDPNLYRINVLEVAHFKATGEEKEKLAKEIEEFYEQYPQYKGKVDLAINANGRLQADIMIENYKNLYKFDYIASQIEKVSSLSKEDFEKLPQEEKREITIALFKGFDYHNKKSKKFETLGANCKNMLLKLFPDLNLEENSLEGNSKELTTITKEILGIDMKREINPETFLRLADSQLDVCVSEYLIKNQDVYKTNDDPNTVMSSEEFREAINNFYTGSKIKNTGLEYEHFEYVHQIAVINSWIENKDEAILVRYMSLEDMKKRLEQLPESDYKTKMLTKVNADREEFDEKFGEKLTEIYGAPETWGARKEKSYTDIYRSKQNQMEKLTISEAFKSDLIKYRDGITYDKMSVSEKEEYIRNTIAVFDIIKDSPSDSIAKMAMRRLELMNTDEKKFVTFDEDGNVQIDESLILQEYQELTGERFDSFESLETYCEFEKSNNALKEWGKIVEESKKFFKVITRKSNVKRAYELLENHKQSYRNKEKVKEENKKDESSKTEEKTTTTDENSKPITDKELAAAMRAKGMMAETLVDTAIRSTEKEGPVQTQEEKTTEETTKTTVESGRNVQPDITSEPEIEDDTNNDSDTSSENELEEVENESKELMVINNSFMGRLGNMFSQIKDKLFGKKNESKKVTKAEKNAKKETTVNDVEEKNANNQALTNRAKDFNERYRYTPSQDGNNTQDQIPANNNVERHTKQNGTQNDIEEDRSF